MFAEPTLIPLADGMTIACDEYGDPSGAPVFFFHGWPASRMQGAGLGPAARELGLRILALDRPGVGLSTYRPGWRLLDWPPVVAEVARALGLEKFRIMAMSGGGPYGLASAWALPGMVRAVAIVSGAPPLPQQFTAGEIWFVYRILLSAFRRRPELLRRLFQWGRPIATVRPPWWLVSLVLRAGKEADREALGAPGVYDGSFANYREAWRGSGLGVAADGEIHAQPWGFAPEEIRVPVRLWHGGSDGSFSAASARRLGGRIPGCRVRIVENEGHYSLPLRHAREILEDLRGAGNGE
jgi:pimeloyl-ACP methyl ester carboxylesterase